MRFSASPLALLACAALAPAAAAQSTFPTFTEVPGTVNPLGSLSVDAVGAPTFGDLTGDGVPDLLYAPAEVTAFPTRQRSGALATLLASRGTAAPAPSRAGGGTDFLLFDGVRGADGRVAFVPAGTNPFAGLQTDAASEVVVHPALADLDGDGDLDLVASAFFDIDGRVVYFENVGTAAAASFAYRGDAAGLDAVTPGFPTFADLDGDGDADLVTVVPAEAGAQVLYFENTGTPQSPAFTAAANPFGDAVFSVITFAPAFLDADEDGDLDAVVGSVDVLFGDVGSARLEVFENVGAVGAPAFVLADEQPLADLGPDPLGSSDTAAPAAADLDGDGDADLAAVLGVGPFPRSLYFENTGTGGIVAFERATGLANPLRFTALNDGGDDVYTPLAPGDLDGDGDLDLVIGTSDTGPLRYAENVGTAAAPAFRLRSEGQNPFGAFVFEDLSSAMLADLDADGDLDVAVSVVLGDGAPGRFVYLENVGTASAPVFAERSGAADPFAGLFAGFSPSGTDLVDLDGDGDLDLVAGVLDLASFSAGLRYAENVGTAAAPSFVEIAEEESPLPAVQGTVLLGPALADLDGDGDLDLVLTEPDLNSDIGLGAVRVFLNTGTAQDPAFENITGAGGLFGGSAVLPSRFALADFDGDGDVDTFSGVATTSAFDGGEELSGNRIRFFLNNGDVRVDAQPAAAPRGGLALGQPFPNPLSGAAQLRLVLGEAQHVKAEAFDALGRRVAVLHDGPLAAGTDHVLRFDAAALPAGLYVIRVQSAAGATVRRVTKL